MPSSRGSNKPRPYSTLRDGKIVWVAPGEVLPLKKMRSRPESDEEVSKRIIAEHKRLIAANPWNAWFGAPKAVPNTSSGLDAELKELGLPPRGWIDEEA